MAVTESIGRISNEVTAQKNLIAQIQSALEGKAAGSGGGGAPSTIVAGDTPVLYAAGAYNGISTSLTATGISLKIPKAGTYRFKWTVAGGGGSGYAVKSRLYQNGAAVGTQTSTTSSAAYTLDLACSAGDTIELYFAAYDYWGVKYGGCGGLCACIDWDIWSDTGSSVPSAEGVSF